jgi:hypothetical protein
MQKALQFTGAPFLFGQSLKLSFGADAASLDPKSLLVTDR